MTKNPPRCAQKELILSQRKNANREVTRRFQKEKKFMSRCFDKICEKEFKKNS
jgi:hypothetical protein